MATAAIITRITALIPVAAILVILAEERVVLIMSHAYAIMVALDHLAQFVKVQNGPISGRIGTF